MLDPASQSHSSIQARIDAAGADIDALEAVDAELAVVDTPELRLYRLKIRQKIMALRKSDPPARGTNAAPLAATRPSLGLWRELLKSMNVDRPDGRPLHRYRLSNDGADQIRDFLSIEARRGLDPERLHTAALFVLWAAHWFQKDYGGGIRNWNDLGSALGLALDGNIGRLLVERGLRVWRRPVHQVENVHHWLRTLAIEGGFPVAILNQANGWVGRYLERVVATLLSMDEQGPETAYEAAKFQEDFARSTYRQGVFFAIAGDLARAVVRLRRDTEADIRPAGVPLSGWLDQTRPDWRDALPIPATSEAASRLVDGLMHVEAFHMGGTVGCERLLRRRDGIWRPALRLGLDGTAKGDFARALGQSAPHLRAFPGGHFARHAHGELARFEPPGDGGNDWRVRPSRRDPVIEDVPFDVPVTISLRKQEEALREIDWPGGSARRVILGIFAIEGDLPSPSCTLVLLGTGSGAFKPECVVVAVPTGWHLSAEGSGQCSPLDDHLVMEGQSGDNRRTLWMVSGIARVLTDDGDSYRIACGSESTQSDRLILGAGPPEGLESDDPDIELCCGMPRLHVNDGKGQRDARPGEICWRRAGERKWRPMPLREFGETGLVEFGWLDAASRYVRDRRKACILPKSSRVAFRREDRESGYDLTGVTSAMFRSVDDNLVLEATDPWILKARFRDRPARRARFSLIVGANLSVPASAAFPTGHGLATWSGQRVAGGTIAHPARLTSAQFGALIAYSDSRRMLQAQLFGRDHWRIPSGFVEWRVDDERPLRPVADELAALMAPFADIDAKIQVSFQNERDFWVINQFEGELVQRGGQWTFISSGDASEALPCFARRLDQPGDEISLGLLCSPGGHIPRRAFEMVLTPGSWLVYLRRGGAVATRPVIMHAAQPEAPPQPGFPAAALVAEEGQRQEAFRACLTGLAHGGATAAGDVDWLLRLISGLNGLPAACFDVCRLVGENPAAAARVAMAASKEQLTAVLSLSEELPFAWCMVPVACWAKAADLQSTSLQEKILTIPGIDRIPAETMVKGAIRHVAGHLAKAEPLLRRPLFAAGLLDHSPEWECDRVELMQAARDHIARYGEDVPETGPTSSLFRSRVPTGKLPNFDFAPVHLECLDAPCAAALAAAGEATFDAEAVRRIKTAWRQDSTYFKQAYEAWFVHLQRGRTA